MVRRLVPLPLLALLVAGCGGAGAPAPSAPATPAPAAESAPAGSQQALVVGGTDLRLGGAQADDGQGPRKLAGGSRPDPDELRAQGRRKDGVGAGDSCPDQDLQPSSANTAQVVASTLCLLNGQRADAGLGPLGEDAKLAQAAAVHSRDMIDNSFFSHTGKDGSSSTDRIRAAGYIPTDKAWTVGENLAWGTGNLATPRSIVAAWMNSPGHRENILRPAFNQIGFGVVIGNPSRTDGQGATYTTTFGSLGSSGAASGSGTAPVPASTPAAPAGDGARAVKSESSSSKSKSKARKLRRKRARGARARTARAKAARAKAARAKGARARTAKGER